MRHRMGIKPWERSPLSPSSVLGAPLLQNKRSGRLSESDAPADHHHQTLGFFSLRCLPSFSSIRGKSAVLHRSLLLSLFFGVRSCQFSN